MNRTVNIKHIILCIVQITVICGCSKEHIPTYSTINSCLVVEVLRNVTGEPLDTSVHVNIDFKAYKISNNLLEIYLLDSNSVEERNQILLYNYSLHGKIGTGEAGFCEFLNIPSREVLLEAYPYLKDDAHKFYIKEIDRAGCITVQYQDKVRRIDIGYEYNINFSPERINNEMGCFLVKNDIIIKNHGFYDISNIIIK